MIACRCRVGILINQSLVVDSKNGSGDETLLKHHYEFTAVRILPRVVKSQSPPAHNIMLKNIRQYFVETSQGHKDNIST